MDDCYLCGSKEYHILHKGVRDDKDIDVLKCDKCGLVRLSKFIVKPEEFYGKSGMREEDKEESIEDIIKTAEQDDVRRFVTIEEIIKDKTLLDFGCGAGGFLSYAQNIAQQVVGIELEDKMRSYLERQSIKCYSSLKSVGDNEKFDVITMFHVLEHLENPCDFLNQLKSLLMEHGTIFLEVPNADDALLTLYQSSEFADFTYWKCHLYLYTNDTLGKLAQKCGLRIKFIKQVQRYPLSNHLFWLAKKLPGGHQKWDYLNNPLLAQEYEKLLSGLGVADTIIAAFENNE